MSWIALAFAAPVLLVAVLGAARVSSSLFAAKRGLPPEGSA